MDELKKLLKGFASRKLLMTVGIILMAYHLPIKFKSDGISDAVTMVSLGIITAAGVAYKILNVKDSKFNG